MGSRPRAVLLVATAAFLAPLLAPVAATAVTTGAIEGTVTDASSTLGVEEVEVCAIDPVELEYVACDYTGPDGEYALTGLLEGDYAIEFWAPYLGYLIQFFDRAELFEDADEVAVSAGATVAGIDAVLEKGGWIEGRVTDASSGSPLGQVEVCAYPQATPYYGCALTDSAGEYTVGPFGSDSFYVEFWAEYLDYETRYYDETANPLEASPVAVTPPAATTGIDAKLTSLPTAPLPAPSGAPTPSTSPAPVASKPKPRPARRCRRGFKKVKRHGRKVCVKKHKRKRRKHRKRHHQR